MDWGKKVFVLIPFSNLTSMQSYGLDSWHMLAHLESGKLTSRFVLGNLYVQTVGKSFKVIMIIQVLLLK